jgi:hypothetical protein
MFMKKAHWLLPFICFTLLSSRVLAQTNKNIQGTWQLISSTISGNDWSFKMDSSTHNMTKIITQGRVMFTLYNKKTDSLDISGQGRATTKGNQYIETFEQSNAKALLTQPIIYTYRVEGNKLFYEGGTKDIRIVEVLRRIE